MPQRPEFLERGRPVRLQSFLSRSGLSSRRGAEEMIEQGRVAVNGRTVTVMGTTVRPGVDRVELDGEEVRVAPVTWIALHKPRGYVTTRTDPFDRPTVYDLLPEKYHGLFHVGRLDRDSEGILLLTNDGETANRLLHPSHGATKEYEVVITGKPADATLRRLVEGVELEDGVARAESAKLLGPAGSGLSRLRLVLREGRKREVRRMLEAVGHPVTSLVRRRFGPVTLAELPKGRYRVVAAEELAGAGEPRSRRGRSAAAPDAEARPAARKTKPASAGARPAARKTKPAGAEARPAARKTKPAAAGAGPAAPGAKPRGRKSGAGGEPRPAAGGGRTPAGAPSPAGRSGQDRERPPAPGGRRPAGRPTGGEGPAGEHPGGRKPGAPARGSKPGPAARRPDRHGDDGGGDSRGRRSPGGRSGGSGGPRTRGGSGRPGRKRPGGDA
jgi:23S rRNA pseudouridine2605 synthase